MRYQTAPLPAFAEGFGGQARQSRWFASRSSAWSEGWWARKDSNLQPSRYERPALPLSYRPPRCLGDRRAGAAPPSQPRLKTKIGGRRTCQLGSRNSRQPADQAQREFLAERPA